MELVNSGINLHKLVDLTSKVDSSGCIQCDYMITISSDHTCYTIY